MLKQLAEEQSRFTAQVKYISIPVTKQTLEYAYRQYVAELLAGKSKGATSAAKFAPSSSGTAPKAAPVIKHRPDKPSQPSSSGRTFSNSAQITPDTTLPKIADLTVGPTASSEPQEVPKSCGNQAMDTGNPKPALNNQGQTMHDSAHTGFGTTPQDNIGVHPS
ncbi:uncharacterized protein RCC_00436 [Ramularia collo-cygni]|uniref:Uncharacterized protein n=1 Tax=Ramularia collo-cygni TaxID=112498 RepID=A0A2D3UZ30_9PEZI|nr:uncharacterized protein RCC_00436 [Ramularia collo-cygni]CZT14459.1 uncharacterized protein RCC_00436 [Ramularia collo-cygni]